MHEENEQDVHFAVRRNGEWSNMVGSPAWADFAYMVERSRTSIVRELISGAPNRYGERCDDEKRAMIHAFDTILSLPIGIKRDAEQARDNINRFRQRAS